MLILDGDDEVTRQKIKDPNIYQVITADPEDLLQDLPGIVWHNNILYNIDGKDEKPIANFIAIPIEVLNCDDGNDQTIKYNIVGRKSDGKNIILLRIITIKASELAGMRWIDKWGFAANIYPPNSRNKDILRCVTTMIGARTAKQKLCYNHTGWRQINNIWYYLHGNGAIGANDIEVQLDDDLTLYGMPDNTGDKDTRDNALRTVFEVADKHLVLPLIALVFLCPLNEFLRQCKHEPAFILYLVGYTQLHKSTLAALMLSFFGCFTDKEPPANFEDTIGALEYKASILKDTLLLVDDYFPAKSSDLKEMESKMQLLSRMYGNRSAKGRLKPNITLRESKISHGNIVVTAENVADIGKSGLARNLIIEVLSDSIPVSDALNAAQAYAKDGILAAIMRDYIEWLKPQSNNLKQRHDDIFSLYRKRARHDNICSEGRTGDTIAWLMTGLYMLLLYSQDRKIDGIDSTDWWDILTQIALYQIELSRETTNTQMFLDAVSQLFATGKIYVDDINNPPTLNHKSGNKVGYADADNYYFFHDLIYKAVYNYYSGLHQTFTYDCKRLLKQFADEGISVTSNGRFLYQKRIGNTNDRYLCIPRHYIDGISDGQDDSDAN